MTYWKPISEAGDVTSILSPFFNGNGDLCDIHAMTIVDTERGKFWVFIETVADRDGNGGEWPYDAWDAPQPEYFVPLPMTPLAVTAKQGDAA